MGRCRLIYMNDMETYTEDELAAVAENHARSQDPNFDPWAAVARTNRAEGRS